MANNIDTNDKDTINNQSQIILNCNLTGVELLRKGHIERLYKLHSILQEKQDLLSSSLITKNQNLTDVNSLNLLKLESEILTETNNYKDELSTLSTSYKPQINKN